jgi:hypothetical protein
MTLPKNCGRSATITVLYLSLALIVAVVIGLAFLIAWLIAGQAY